MPPLVRLWLGLVFGLANGIEGQARSTLCGGVTVVVSEVDDTETNVTGLTPSVLYTFSVTAENDVSSQDNNINVRTVTTTATTEEGGLFG